MELRQLRYFLSLAETEHLTQSAQALFITQSTLSHGLRQLEDELGTVLFDRIGRGLKISQAGLAYKSFVGRAIQELEAGRMALAQLNGLQSGTLTVGVIPTFMDTLVPAAVAHFSANHPGIRVSIRDLRADLIEKHLVSGQLDVGIAFHPTQHADIDAEHLFSEQLQLLVSVDHRLAKRRSLRMQDLKNVPLCLLPKSFATRRMLDDAFKSADISPEIRVEMESVNALIEACKTGTLATIVPERAASMNQTQFRAISLHAPQPLRHAGILWRKGASRSLAAQAFVQELGSQTQSGSKFS